MNKSDLQFQINQLRQDKIIYATESVAVSLAMGFLLLLLLVFLPVDSPIITFQGVSYPVLPVITCTVAVVYWLFITIGNLMRFQKIKELEKQLMTNSPT